MAVCLLPLGAARRSQAGEFARFVDRYLDDFARRHPSIAAGNGIHDHDDLLDDFSAAGIRAEIAALERDRARLRAFDPKALTPDERVDRRILDGIIDGWLLEQETLENWRRNPMIYASALTDGVHNLMTMENEPAPARMRRIISKLRGVPALLAAARANIANPPKLFAERGASMMRGASAMLGDRSRPCLRVESGDRAARFPSRRGEVGANADRRIRGLPRARRCAQGDGRLCHRRAPISRAGIAPKS